MLFRSASKSDWLPKIFLKGSFGYAARDLNENGEIVYGIGAIKGVGEGPIDALITARNEGGIFRDLFDLCARVDLKKINRRTFESLIMSGAFDKLGPHRAALSKNLEDALKASDQHAKDEAMGQTDMFGVDRKSTRLNSSHPSSSRMPSSA